MSTSAWVTASAALDVVLALFFLLRWARRPRCGRDCAVHGLMALAMAVMASPWGPLVPPAAGVGVFAAAALWGGRHVLASRGRGDHGPLQICTSSAVMAAMYLLALLGPDTGHEHGSGPAGAVAVWPITVALVCAGALAFQVGRSLTLLAVGPGVARIPGTAMMPTPELAGGALMSCSMIVMLVTGLV